MYFVLPPPFPIALGCRLKGNLFPVTLPGAEAPFEGEKSVHTYVCVRTGMLYVLFKKDVHWGESSENIHRMVNTGEIAGDFRFMLFFYV